MALSCREIHYQHFTALPKNAVKKTVTRAPQSLNDSELGEIVLAKELDEHLRVYFAVER